MVRTQRTMPGGYCYELERHADWRRSPSDDWAIEVYTPSGDEQEVGGRVIDGAACVVFLCRDAQYRAVTEASVDN